ncbi:wdr41-related [Anaeramoeba flamelloides]|uniref:Wdr41-related n=1 Tax=Anaeramoeba flamelloides TaxID=1746091 RepID=A0AAV7ZBE8_9EUKA|nr:wdr41-related [Anaeramoeba flamelloides]
MGNLQENSPLPKINIPQVSTNNKTSQTFLDNESTKNSPINSLQLLIGHNSKVNHLLLLSEGRFLSFSDSKCFLWDYTLGVKLASFDITPDLFRQYQKEKELTTNNKLEKGTNEENNEEEKNEKKEKIEKNEKKQKEQGQEQVEKEKETKQQQTNHFPKEQTSVTCVLSCNNGNCVVIGISDGSLLFITNNRNSPNTIDPIMIPVRAHNSSIRKLISLNEASVLSISEKDEIVKVWSVDDGTLRSQIDLMNNPKFIYLACPISDEQIAVIYANVETIFVYSIHKNHNENENENENEKQKISQLTKHKTSIQGLAVLEKGKSFVTVDSFGLVRLWDTKKLKQLEYDRIADQKKKENAILIARLSKNRFAVSFLNDITIYHCNFEKLTKFKVIKNAHLDIIQHLVPFNNGKWVISCSYPGTIAIWNTSEIITKRKKRKQSILKRNTENLRLSQENSKHCIEWISPIHTGMVNQLIVLSESCFATGSSDSLVILWKNFETEKQKLNFLVKEHLSQYFMDSDLYDFNQEKETKKIKK